MVYQNDTLSHTGGRGNVEGLETNKCHVSWPAYVSSGLQSLNLVHPAAVACDERPGGPACSPKCPASTVLGVSAIRRENVALDEQVVTCGHKLLGTLHGQ